MPTKRVVAGGTTFIVTEQEDWKPGDVFTGHESDYLGWHAWAEVQHKAGLRQRECGSCHRWKYPQELSDKYLPPTTLYRDKAMTKPFTVPGASLCLRCAPTSEVDRGAK